jgi:hypothetical protein
MAKLENPVRVDINLSVAPHELFVLSTRVITAYQAVVEAIVADLQDQGLNGGIFSVKTIATMKVAGQLNSELEEQTDLLVEALKREKAKAS